MGSPKTGTTYLQSVLWQSRREVARQGLVLPLRRSDHFYLSVQLREVVDPDVDPRGVATVLERMRAAVASAPGDVLITNELLSVATPAGVERMLALLEGVEVHIVVTARDWARQIPAEWQQFVKTRHQGTYEHFLDALRDNPEHRFWQAQDYAEVLARWGASLPPDQVHVVTVPPAGAPPGLLLERFCSVVGLDPAPLDSDTPRGNPSLGFEQAELMRRINTTLGGRMPKPRAGYNRVAKFWFAEKVLTTTAGTRLVLPADRWPWSEEISRAQVERLDAAGYDVVGDLRDLTPGAPAGGEKPMAATDSALLEIALEGLAAALTQRDEDLRRIKELKGELKRSQKATQKALNQATQQTPKQAPKQAPERAAARAQAPASERASFVRRVARGVRRRARR